MDSLGSVELRNALADHLAVSLPSTATFDHSTIADMASFISSMKMVHMEEQLQLPQQEMQPPVLEDIEDSIASVVRLVLGSSMLPDRVRPLWHMPTMDCTPHQWLGDE